MTEGPTSTTGLADIAERQIAAAVRQTAADTGFVLLSDAELIAGALLYIGDQLLAICGELQEIDMKLGGGAE